MQPNWIKWVPRVLGLMLVAFLGAFSLDVFSEGHGFPELLVALFMHLLPALAVLAAVAVGWRSPRPGAAVFLALGAFAAWYFRGFDGNPFALVLGTVCALIAVLFWICSGPTARPAPA